MKKVVFNWSTGKDSAMAFYHLMQNTDWEVGHLMTTVNTHFDRVSMHGLRRSLLNQQVEALGLPFSTVELPEMPDMKEYEELMYNALSPLVNKGFTYAGFGDIFLEDLKLYREQQLEKIGMKAVFPLWKQDTRQLIDDFLEKGFKAIVVCANAKYMDDSFVGRELTHEFVKDLPKEVDPCGENGEFHTFCFDGPIFSHPISFEVGEKVLRHYPDPTDSTKKNGFWYCDLI